MIATLNMGLGLSVIGLSTFYSVVYARNTEISKTFIGRYANTDLPTPQKMLKATTVFVTAVSSKPHNGTLALPFSNIYEAILHVGTLLEEMNQHYVDVYRLDNDDYFIKIDNPDNDDLIDIKSILISQG